VNGRLDGLNVEGMILNANVFLLDNNSILKRCNDTYTRRRISHAPCAKKSEFWCLR
jgi:hypothetical protein